MKVDGKVNSSVKLPVLLSSYLTLEQRSLGESSPIIKDISLKLNI